MGVLIVIFCTVRLLLDQFSNVYDTGINLLWGNIGYTPLKLSIPQGCFWRMICYLVSVISSAMLLLAVPMNGRSIKADWLISWVGSNTLSVYLLHYPVLLLLWRKVFPADIPIPILILVCMILTLILSVPVLSQPLSWLQTKMLELAAPI